VLASADQVEVSGAAFVPICLKAHGDLLVLGPSFNPLLPKQFLVHARDNASDGQEMFEHAAKLNFEGIVSKNATAPYRSGQNEGWLKIKTVQKGKFPVFGFIKDPTVIRVVEHPKTKNDRSS
jgi:hypothetical protein